MPPFGVPELAGWTTDKVKFPSFLRSRMSHPWDRNTFPRAVYVGNGNNDNLVKLKNTNERLIYLAAPDSSTIAASIPISGVSVLVSDSCSFHVWHVI